MRHPRSYPALAHPIQRLDAELLVAFDLARFVSNRPFGTTDLATAERDEMEVRNTRSHLLEITRRRFAASVLLVKALGGGWDSSEFPKKL